MLGVFVKATPLVKHHLLPLLMICCCEIGQRVRSIEQGWGWGRVVGAAFRRTCCNEGEDNRW